jgi:hypothetical protein
LLESYTPLPHFTGVSWQGGPKLPDPTLNWVSLNSNGGHPGPAGFASVRRWTAPRDMTISMAGDVIHGSEHGDGVFGYVISSSGEILWKGHARNSTAHSSFSDIAVKAGDTIDMVIDSGADQNHDSFSWHPRIHVSENADSQAPPGGRREWLAQEEFTGPPLPPMEPWAKYAQVLLMSNEFMFVD